ncbi:MAG: efflux RND transporter permease subunit [Betaproteobacteria bacterium]|nr:efflux RND transporter permease subunit [Betaproteobacteria bacterium]
MRGLMAWMARHPVAANLLMLFILIAGVSSALTMKQEVFPLVELDVLEVRVLYPGAAPDEVEEAIAQKIEEQIEGLDGIDRVTSIAAEGAGVVRIELMRGVSAAAKLDEVKAAVDRITTFPAEAERPEIKELVSRQRVIELAVYGDASEATLREMAYRIKDDLTGAPGISLVQVARVRDYEISVEVANDTLRAYGLTLQDIAATLKRSSLDLPSGDIKAGGESILLRARGRNYDRADFERVVVVSSATGARVRLADIARIDDGFRDDDLIMRFNGKPAAFVQVFRVGEDKVLDVVRQVNAYLAELRASVPPGIEVLVWRDDSVEFRNRMDLLLKNGALGLALVLAALALFLDLRLALWVSAGIFVAFVGTFAVMPFVGLSINMMSLFGFILAIGIVVDDAIVTGENIYAENERGTPEVEAAVRGSQRVALPVALAVSTTVAAFVPLLFAPGTLGKFLYQIPAVVIIVLMISVLEAMLILPHHLAHLRIAGFTPRTRIGAWLAGLRHATDRGLRRFVDGPLDAALRFSTAHYGVVIAAAASIFLLALGTVTAGHLKFVFFPQVEGRYVTASLELRPGATAETTLVAALALERAGREAAASLPDPSGRDLVNAVYVTVGQQEATGPGAAGALGLLQGNKASIVFELLDPEVRSITSGEFERRWRELAGTPPRVRKLTFASNVIQLGSPVQIELSARTPQGLAQATQALQDELRRIDGVFDVRDDRDPGKQEVQFQLKPSARALGLTLESLSLQVRAAFFGAEALRVQRGRDEVRVYVRLPRAERASLADLARHRIRTPAGGFVPLHEVAELTLGYGPSTIVRRDGRRVSTVLAEVDSRVITGQQVNTRLTDEVIPALQREIPGLSYAMGGEQREQGRTLPSLARNFVLALFGMYALLALAFRSYVQPLIVLASIPFGLVGAVVGHLVMGLSMGLTSLFGVVGLAGIIVNGSLVLIDFINEERERGKPAAQAIQDACKSRFRPILLTAVTTFLGIFPLIVEKSIQAQFLIPLAVSIGVGVLLGTMMQMLLTPALAMWVEALRERWAAHAARRAARES